MHSLKISIVRFIRTHVLIIPRNKVRNHSDTGQMNNFFTIIISKIQINSSITIHNTGLNISKNEVLNMNGSHKIGIDCQIMHIGLLRGRRIQLR